MLESWTIDVRYVVRRLLGHPSYVVLAVLTLALGTGGAAAIYSVVRPLLLEPLPYSNENELAVFWQPSGWTEEEFLYLRPAATGFRSIAAYTTTDVTLQLGAGPLRLIPSVAASAELFDVLGTRPLLGRTFASGDDQRGAEPVAVLSYSLWQQLGGDRSVIGQRIRLDGVAHTIVGVMPSAFWFPDPTVRVWTERPFDPAGAVGVYTLIGRVQAGLRLERMAPALGQIAATLRRRFTYPRDWDKTRNPSLTPLHTYLVGPVKPALVATVIAMATILLIACVNVAALMLGQVDGRATELAVRTALGGTRRGLMQQLFVEALVLGVMAGASGGGLAAAGFRVLVSELPLGPLAEAARLSWTPFWAALAVALLAALLSALVPTFALSRGDLQPVLARTRMAGTGTRRGPVEPLEGGIVVAQVALAMVLAVGAGLLIRSVGHLRAVDPGLDPRGVAVLDVALPAGGTAERQRALDALLPALAQLPGARHVAATQKLPLRGQGWNVGMAIEGRPDLSAGQTYFRLVTPGYFAALRIRLREGRVFDETDRAQTERVAVVNQALVRQYFSGVSPLGQRISCGGPGWARVIGVVSDVAEANLTAAFGPARYCLYDQSPFVPQGSALVIRTDPTGDPGALLGAARRTVEQLAPEVAVRGGTTMESVLTQAMGPVRQVLVLLALFTALALVLAAIGIYGVISHFVMRRRRAWSIRLALGLAPSGVLAHVVGRSAALVAVGSALGMLGALALARLLTSFLYGVRFADPVAMAVALLSLAVVGLTAAFVPALRASRSDPAAVLREQ
jgi:putative ABC transport system permease protein